LEEDIYHFFPLFVSDITSPYGNNRIFSLRQIYWGRPGAAAATKEREKYPHDQSYRTEIDFPTFKEQYGCAYSTSTL
jgi:hypothetical protein